MRFCNGLELRGDSAIPCAIVAIYKENHSEMHVWYLRRRFRPIPASVFSVMVVITCKNTNLVDSRSLAFVTPSDVVPPMGRECKNPLTRDRWLHQTEISRHEKNEKLILSFFAIFMANL